MKQKSQRPFDPLQGAKDIQSQLFINYSFPKILIVNNNEKSREIKIGETAKFRTKSYQKYLIGAL